MPNTSLNAIILSQRRVVRELLGELLIVRCGARIVAQLESPEQPLTLLPSAHILAIDENGIPAAHLDAWLGRLLAERPGLRAIRIDDSLPTFGLDGIVAAVRGTRTRLHAPHDRLTPLETDVLVAVASGKRNSEIARHMRRSPKTVEKHRANAQRKLGFRNVAQLTAYAIRYGLIEPDALLGRRDPEDC